MQDFNMYYMLTPLHTHIDFGFGATGEAFKRAADNLEESLPEKGDVLNGRLPINYLRRHAIELFLKSAITIIHKQLTLPYGDKPSTTIPYAFDGSKWVLLTNLHSVKKLWTYLKTLFLDQKSFFDSVERVDWSFPSEVDSWIFKIDNLDPRSTFFRYPTLNENETDSVKSVMIESPTPDIMDRLKESDSPTGKLVLLLENDAGEITRGFISGEDTLSEISLILKKCSDLFYGTHAALRCEVCGGA
ncbi:MAG: hypothetical protein PHE51_10425 [Eubacteriales bacterium]|nr:hypothetical protein [Eubacteriales bacterium]